MIAVTSRDVTYQVTYPIPRPCPFQAPAEYERLRSDHPVAKVRLPQGGEAWLVTGYEQARAVLVDRRFSSDRNRPGFPMLVLAKKTTVGHPRLLNGMDPPEHTEARRAVLGEFTVRRAEALRPMIQSIVDGFVDAMLAGPRPADLVAALSLPVASAVICELLGLPVADRDLFHRHTTALVDRNTAEPRRQAVGEELRAYLADLVARKEREPTDDLIGRQIRAARSGHRPFDRERLVGIALLLVLAGHDTVANMISLGTLALLEKPDQLAKITAAPGRIRNAVEELLRYFSIVESATSRMATTDVRLGDVLVRAGDGVIVSGQAANWDSARFDHPGTLDVDRDSRHHVAFGFGPHQCLGQHLARVELQVVFDTLFRRVPGLRLAAAVDELPFRRNAAVYGVHELPVTW